MLDNGFHDFDIELQSRMVLGAIALHGVSRRAGCGGLLLMGVDVVLR